MFVIYFDNYKRYRPTAGLNRPLCKKDLCRMSITKTSNYENLESVSEFQFFNLEQQLSCNLF